MAFVLFKNYRNSPRETVTLRANGFLYIPNEMLAKYGMIESYHKFTLYIDDEKPALFGIKFKPDGYRKTILEKRGISVNVRPILFQLGIRNAESSKSFVPKLIDNMLVIDLLKEFKYDKKKK